MTFTWQKSILISKYNILLQGRKVSVNEKACYYTYCTWCYRFYYRMFQFSVNYRLSLHMALNKEIAYNITTVHCQILLPAWNWKRRERLRERFLTQNRKDDLTSGRDGETSSTVSLGRSSMDPPEDPENTKELSEHCLSCSGIIQGALLDVNTKQQWWMWLVNNKDWAAAGPTTWGMKEGKSEEQERSEWETEPLSF